MTLVIQLAGGVDDWKQTALGVGVFWLIGMNGIILGSGHLFIPAPIAESIGWAPSPFQWEVGLANVGWGVLGVTASSFDRDYTLATIIVFFGLHAGGGPWAHPVDGARTQLRSRQRGLHLLVRHHRPSPPDRALHRHPLTAARRSRLDVA